MSEFAQGMVVGIAITLIAMFVILAVLVGRKISKQDQRVNDRR